MNCHNTNVWKDKIHELRYSPCSQITRCRLDCVCNFLFPPLLILFCRKCFSFTTAWSLLYWNVQRVLLDARTRHRCDKRLRINTYTNKQHVLSIISSDEVLRTIRNLECLMSIGATHLCARCCPICSCNSREITAREREVGRHHEIWCLGSKADLRTCMDLYFTPLSRF